MSNKNTYVKYIKAMKERDDAIGCLAAVLVLILMIGLMFLGPAIVMWLWNFAIVGVFGLPAITFWQAFAIKWLCSLLFKTSINWSSMLED